MDNLAQIQQAQKDLKYYSLENKDSKDPKVISKKIEFKKRIWALRDQQGVTTEEATIEDETKVQDQKEATVENETKVQDEEVITEEATVTDEKEITEDDEGSLLQNAESNKKTSPLNNDNTQKNKSNSESSSSSNYDKLNSFGKKSGLDPFGVAGSFAKFGSKLGSMGSFTLPLAGIGLATTLVDGIGNLFGDDTENSSVRYNEETIIGEDLKTVSAGSIGLALTPFLKYFLFSKKRRTNKTIKTNITKVRKQAKKKNISKDRINTKLSPYLASLLYPVEKKEEKEFHNLIPLDKKYFFYLDKKGIEQCESY